MRSTTTSKWSSLKVGTLLLIAISIAIWASVSGGGTSIFDNKIVFVAYFKNVNGLVKGSPVWVAGMEVGNVKTLNFVNLDSTRQVEVIFRVKQSVWPLITQGAEVQLGTIGLLGDKLVEVVPGPTDAERIIEGNVIPTSDPGSAESLFAAGTEAMEEAGSLIGNLDDVLGKMSRGEGTLGKLSTDDKLYAQLSSLSSNLNTLVNDMQANQERVWSSIEVTAESISKLTNKVDQNSGTLGKIINDPQLYDNLAATSARLDTLLGKLNTAEGSLGLMVSDTALYMETVDLLTRMSNLVSDIEKNPGRYFKFSIF